MVGRCALFPGRGTHPRYQILVSANFLHPQANAFVVVDSTVSLLVLLHRTSLLEPRLDIDQRTVISRMVNKVRDLLFPICVRMLKLA
jgi:hypothetical protein